jgi:hypothetical protein
MKQDHGISRLKTRHFIVVVVQWRLTGDEGKTTDILSWRSYTRSRTKVMLSVDLYIVELLRQWDTILLLEAIAMRQDSAVSQSDDSTGCRQDFPWYTL